MKKKQLKKQVTEKEYLGILLEQFIKLQAGSRNKLEKYEDLSKRVGAKDWDDSKRKKVQNRLAQAKLEYEQTFEIIDNIKKKLEQL